jgi:predicted nucleic acid-binding protein
MVIIDTSVLAAVLDSRVNLHSMWLESQRNRERFGITTLTLAEVLQGIRVDNAFVAALGALSDFEVFETGSKALAIESARNYRILRKQGFTIRSTIDCLIATFCIQNEYELLHNDCDFDPFEAHLGLQVVHPS